jgi:hypothetical protein
MDPLKIPAREWTELEELPDSLWTQWQERRVAQGRRTRVLLTLMFGVMVGGGGFLAHSHRASTRSAEVAALSSHSADDMDADIEDEALAFADGEDPEFSTALIDAPSYAELADNGLTDAEP